MKSAKTIDHFAWAILRKPHNVETVIDRKAESMSNRKSISRDDIQRQKYIAEHAPALAGQIANGIAASGN